MADEDLTFAELLLPSTARDAMAYLIARLAEAGLPVTNWQPTGRYRSLVAAVAAFLADLAARVPIIARSGFLKWAAGAWLDLKGESDYGLPREPPVAAIVHVRVSNSTGSPITLSAGQLWMTLAAVDDRRWNSTNAGGDVVPAGSFLDVGFRAEFVGSRYSLSFPSPPALVLQTPLTGVTIAAREVTDGDGNGLGTVMVVAGADAESDPQYKARCVARWGALAWAGPALSYDSWAREASKSIRRVYVDDTNPSGPGTVTIYVGGDAGPVGGDDVTAADTKFQVRKPPCSIPTTSNVTATTLTLVAVLECPAGQRTAVRAAIYDALATELRELPIGDGAGRGRFRYHRLEKFVLDALPDGEDSDIDTLTVNGGAVNVIPAKGHVFLVDGAALDPALPWLSFA